MVNKIIRYPQNKIVQKTESIIGGEKITFLDIKTRRKSSKKIPIPKGYMWNSMKNDNKNKKIEVNFIKKR